MKTSNRVRCTAVIAVLGLSVALSALQAFALTQVYPADTCMKMRGGANIVRNTYGGIANDSQAANVYVHCGIINDAFLKLSVAWVAVTDRNPGQNNDDDINCSLIQMKIINPASVPRFSFTNQRTNGASEDFEYLYYLPDPTNPSGRDSTNYFTCLIPKGSVASHSEIHSYIVYEEEPIGMLQAPLPPEIQERQAKAVVEAQEMRAIQALKTEMDDPEWSQKAVTSWRQVFQKEGIKEELKGIQLHNIECRTTLCRMELTPTAPAQGTAAFQEGVSMLILFAPWQVSGFGKIEHPGGQAPVAVLYIAREGHSLP